MTTTITFYPEKATARTADINEVAGVWMNISGDGGITVFLPNLAAQRLLDHMWHSGMRPSHVGIAPQPQPRNRHVSRSPIKKKGDQ